MTHSPIQVVRIASASLLLIVMVANLSSCGIRGPLVLPEPDRAVPAPASSNPAAK